MQRPSCCPEAAESRAARDQGVFQCEPIKQDVYKSHSGDLSDFKSFQWFWKHHLSVWNCWGRCWPHLTGPELGLQRNFPYGSSKWQGQDLAAAVILLQISFCPKNHPLITARTQEVLTFFKPSQVCSTKKFETTKSHQIHAPTSHSSITPNFDSQFISFL